MIDLRLGDWRAVLADVGEVDHLISDPPYSSKTHEGARTSRSSSSSRRKGGRVPASPIAYRAITPDDVTEFVDAWAPRVRGWMAIMTDDTLALHWRNEMARHGRFAFSTVAILQPRPRLTGDGPGAWMVSLMVSRPKTRAMAKWGSLPGAYSSSAQPGIVMGSKPLSLMRELVADYSRPGDLVCDPCAGGATTLIAAATLGRRAVGAEVDEDTYAKAMLRILDGESVIRQPDQTTMRFA